MGGQIALVSLNISDVQNKYYYFAKLLRSKKSDYGFRNVADSTPFLHKANFILDNKYPVI